MCVGDSLWCSEEIVKNLKCSFQFDCYYCYYEAVWEFCEHVCCAQIRGVVITKGLKTQPYGQIHIFTSTDTLALTGDGEMWNICILFCYLSGCNFLCINK